MYDKRYSGRRDLRVNEDVIRRAVENRASTAYEGCKCNTETYELSNRTMPALAMVYTPHQCFVERYSEEKGFTRGTIFSQLDKPFVPCSNAGMRGGSCNGCKM